MTSSGFGGELSRLRGQTCKLDARYDDWTLLFLHAHLREIMLGIGLLLASRFPIDRIKISSEAFHRGEACQRYTKIDDERRSPTQFGERCRHAVLYVSKRQFNPTTAW
eukprot:scaffold292740_cov32-Tisochrysis_lutea.AAC.1